MFHTRALKGYFNSCNQTNKYTYVECIYHVLFITNVPIAVETIISVTNKNTTNPNSLSICISDPHNVSKNVSNFLYSHWISAYLLLKPNRIKLKNTWKMSLLLYVVNVPLVMKKKSVCLSLSYHFTQFSGLYMILVDLYLYLCCFHFHYSVYIY
jgi:hypothetical protein